MTRLLLTFVGVAALQLGTPRPAALAELLRPGGESTSVAPRPETPSRGTLRRDGSRIGALEVDPITPGAPAERPHALLPFAHAASPTEALRRLGPVSAPRVLPDARAPPA